jgi:hypothetical protein
MRAATLVCFLAVFLRHTATAYRSPQWLDQQRQIVRDRKVANQLETVQSKNNALLEASTLSSRAERAEAYRIKEPLPDIDGPCSQTFVYAFSLVVSVDMGLNYAGLMPITSHPDVNSSHSKGL